MDTEALLANIAVALMPVLMAALSWAGMKLAGLLAAKTKSTYVQGLIYRVDEAAMTVVRGLEQRVVGDLKAAAADGKLTAEERARIKTLALAELRSHLGMKGLAELSKVLGLGGLEISRLLSNKIEAAVHDLRSDPL